MPVKKQELSKEVFEIHLDYLSKNLVRINEEMTKFNVKVDTLERTLLRNTVTVEEHQRRSVNIEQRQKKFIESLDTITDRVRDVQIRFSQIEKDIIPIKAHTEQVNKAVKFFLFVDNNKAMLLKMMFFFLVIIFAAIVGFRESEVLRKIIFF